MVAFVITCSQILYLNVKAVGFPHMVQQIWIHIYQIAAPPTLHRKELHISLSITLLVFPN